MEKEGVKKYSIDQSVIEKHKINFIRRANHIHGEKYNYSRVEYKNSTTKVIIICPQHGSFLQTPGNHLSGRKCKECSLESLKSNVGDFLEKSKRVHGDRYDYSLVEYVNPRTKVKIVCKKHGIFEQTPFGHAGQGHNCPSCSPQAKLTTEDFIERSRSVHGDEYDYSLSEYKGNTTSVKIICKKHGIFEQSPSNHWEGSKCTKCTGAYSPSTKEWIEKAQKVHGDKYDYSNSVYVNGGTKVEINCPEHGPFVCLSGNHIGKKSGCPKCSGAGTKSLEEFLFEANQKHAGKFDYSFVRDSYKNTRSKIKIVCPDHGEFTQRAKGHLLSKHACPKCSGVFKETLEGFIIRAKQVYGEKYDYSKTGFTKMLDKVNVICPEHGEFYQGAQNFLNGYGCTLCNPGSRGVGARRIQFLKELLSKEELYIYDPILLYTIFQQSGYERILKRTGVSLNSLITSPPGSEERRRLVDMIGEGINSDNMDDLGTDLDSEEDMSIDLQEIVEIGPNISPEVSSLDLPDTEESFSQVLQAIRSLDDLIYSFDDEQISSMESFFNNKLWRLVMDKKTSIKEIKGMGEKNFSKTIMENFLNEYKEVKSIKIPDGYVFNHKPNLMQLLVVHRLEKTKNHINLSDMGSGKSLGAILASKVLGSKKVLLPCLNSTIEDWIRKIPTYFNKCNLYTLKSLECIRDEEGRIIRGIDPNSYKILDRKNPVLPEEEGTSYLIVNWESFQQHDSESLWNKISSLNDFDLISPDEIQSAKQSGENSQSKRREIFEKILCSQRNKGHEVYVMPLSGTAVTNNLTESKKLIELATGRTYDDLSTFPSIGNAIRHHQILTTIGTRSSSNSKMKINREIIEVDGGHLTEEIISIGKGKVLEMEKTLVPLKLEAIIPKLKKGEPYLFYTDYVTDIVTLVGEKLFAAGFTYGIYTGDQKDGLDKFKNGEIDILIGSRPISTGIDGLQFVCNNLIELILPWTSAAEDQLRKRLDRPGSKFKEVNIMEVHVTINVPTEDAEDRIWSWDRRKRSMIDVKKDLTGCVMDGIIPESKGGNILELMENSKQELRSWIERLEDGREITGQRERIDLKFSETFSPIQRSEYSESEFRNFNRSWATKKSQTLHSELSKDPREWHRYHQLYREARKDWTERPYEVIATELYRRKDWEVGDFGCGDNLLKNYLNGNKVHSFDHVSIDESVISCDISSVPLDDDSLDAAVYSLSLMGTNYMGYLKEGHRVLKPFGKIFICEPLSSGKWDRGNGIEDGIVKSLQESGFTSPKIFKRCDKFIYVIAEKN